MNENLNLVDILKDIPKGTKLYSSLCGDCKFIGIDDSSLLCVVLCDFNGKLWSIYPNGRVTEEGECVVFPSRENRDWATFKVPKKHKEFKPFERVLVREWCDCKSVWTASLYSHYDDALDRHCLLGSGHVEDDRIIPYEGNKNKLGNIIR